MLENFIKVHLPWFIYSIFGNLEKIKSIFLIYQSVRKNSENFMEP